jgi:hypothetical protein
VDVFSLSGKLIPGVAGLKMQAGHGGGWGKNSAHSSNLFLSVSKTLSDNSHDSAVSFKKWSELECQAFLTKKFIKKRDIVSKAI